MTDRIVGAVDIRRLSSSGCSPPHCTAGAGASENAPRAAYAEIRSLAHRNASQGELPQLWNIVRCDMRFVGPRALRPGEIHAKGGDGTVVPLEHVPGYRERHTVRPGLTGLAQVYADRDIAPAHKFRYDRLYIRRRSTVLDLRLILLSFVITFRGSWEGGDASGSGAEAFIDRPRHTGGDVLVVGGGERRQHERPTGCGHPPGAPAS